MQLRTPQARGSRLGRRRHAAPARSPVRRGLPAQRSGGGRLAGAGLVVEVARVVDLPDEFLQDVFEGDRAEGLLAVDDHAEMAAGVLEGGEDLAEWKISLDVGHGPPQPGGDGCVPPAEVELEEVLGVQVPDDVGATGGAGLAEGEAGVAGARDQGFELSG